MRKESRLILALDETECEKAFSIAESVNEFVDAIKINYPLVLSCGLEIVRRISKLNDVICDFKVADIPNTNRLIAEQAFSKGAKGLIVHAFTGSDSLHACVEVAKKYDANVYVVVEMSHPGGLEFMQPNTDRLAEVAVKSGANGVIAPATRPERIAHIRKIIGELQILAPGVGIQGGSAKDAVANGADYVIVGRSIYNAKEPKEIAYKLIGEIKEGLKGRRK
jgi:orotidine-5'-phosphate decarboxylase